MVTLVDHRVLEKFGRHANLGGVEKAWECDVTVPVLRQLVPFLFV